MKNYIITLFIIFTSFTCLAQTITNTIKFDFSTLPPTCTVYNDQGIEIYNEDETKPYGVDLDELKIRITGTVPDNTDLIINDSKENSLNKLSNSNISTGSFKALIASEKFNHEETYNIKIVLNRNTKFDFKVNHSKDKTLKIYTNPEFYTSSQRHNSSNEVPGSKDYYNIYHDLNSENRGPEIVYTKNDTGKIKRVLRVNRTANLNFINFSQNFEKIDHTLTFKDHHLEDGETFKSYINLGKKEAEETADEDTQVDKDSAAEITGTDSGTVKKINSALGSLKSQLTQFQEDLKAYNIGSIEKKNIVADIKSSIKSCFSMEEEFSYANFLEHIKTNGGDEELASEALARLQWVENYSSLLIPGFQVKNVDELIIELDYYENADDTQPKYKRTYEIPILGGVKLDFSTGVIATGLVDEEFLIVNAGNRIDSTFAGDGTFAGADTTQLKKIIREDGNDFKMGFGVLSHIYPRISPYVNVSLTAGFMVEDDLAVQFPVGASVLLGRKSRFILSGGVIFGKAQRLSTKYTLDEAVDASTFTDLSEDQLTKEKSDVKGFFSITYNFGGINVGN